jgi:hypothetical protein
MARPKRPQIDWAIHGDEITELYQQNLSTREVIVEIERRHGITYHSGTLTNYLGRRGVLRSKAESHKLAISKSRRICDACGKEHVPKNYNQRWCDDCSQRGNYSRRLCAHGLPAIVIESVFKAQNQCCAICEKRYDSITHTSKQKTLFIDHDHETNQFRGLLCVRCNTAISYIDDKKWLASAMRYIESAKQAQHPIYTRQPRKHRYVRNKPIVT